jgi:hypothetical protein
VYLRLVIRYRISSYQLLYLTVTQKQIALYLNLPNSRGAFSNSLKDLATRRFGATLLFPFLTQIVEESAVRRHDNTIESDPGGVLVVLKSSDKPMT